MRIRFTEQQEKWIIPILVALIALCSVWLTDYFEEIKENKRRYAELRRNAISLGRQLPMAFGAKETALIKSWGNLHYFELSRSKQNKDFASERANSMETRFHLELSRFYKLQENYEKMVVEESTLLLDNEGERIFKLYNDLWSNMPSETTQSIIAQVKDENKINEACMKTIQKMNEDKNRIVFCMNQIYLIIKKEQKKFK